MFVPALNYMNLLMISGDRMLAAGKRGAFWYTLDVLREHFERIDVVCPRTPAHEGQEKNPFPNVALHPSPHALPLQSLWILREGTRLCAERRYGAMTVQEYPPFYNGFGAWLLARRMKIPYALEIHHLVGSPLASSFTEHAGRVLSQVFLPLDVRGAASVRTVNRSVRDMLISWGVPPAKIEVVPSLYIDHETWKPDASADKHVDFVTAGRLVANKGIGELLRALAEVPQASLLIIGDGPLRSSLESLAASLGLASRVTFTGWLPSHADVAALLRSARVFVMNSRSEGGPRTAVEAMACGLPVLATGVGVMPDIVKDGVNGRIVSFRRDDLVAALRALVADPAACERMGEEAARTARAFDRRTAIAAYAGFLRSLEAHDL